MSNETTKHKAIFKRPGGSRDLIVMIEAPNQKEAVARAKKYAEKKGLNFIWMRRPIKE